MASTNPRKTMDEIRRDAEAQFNKQLDETVVALKAQTPIDTGNARRSWYKKAWRSGESKAVIVNDAPYIEPLDNGHSSQQPRPGWIRRTVERIEQKWANRRTP